MKKKLMILMLFPLGASYVVSSGKKMPELDSSSQCTTSGATASVASPTVDAESASTVASPEEEATVEADSASGESCCICGEELDENEAEGKVVFSNIDPEYILACGHNNFHAGYLQEWFKARAPEDTLCCPMCRRSSPARGVVCEASWNKVAAVQFYMGIPRCRDEANTPSTGELYSLHMTTMNGATGVVESFLNDAMCGYSR